MIYWASVVAVLGWLYAAWASLWPFLINRHVVENGRRISRGYQIGRAVHWRLPPGITLVYGVLSAIPLPVALSLTDRIAFITLTIFSLLITGSWLYIPPGTRLLLAEVEGQDHQLAFGLERTANPLRAVIVLIVFGLLPSLVIGAGIAIAVVQIVAI